MSSSGHLVLVKALLQIPTGNDISFEVFVHFGTLLSVVIVFKNDIAALIKVSVHALMHPRSWSAMYRTSEPFRLALFILIGCIPAGVIGVSFNERIEQLFADPKLVADMLIVTGVILYLTRFAKPAAEAPVTLRSSIATGVAQAVAIIPGISRSGATISMALLMGVSQEHAAKFSFLMAVPVIFGATVLKARHFIDAPPTGDQLQSLIAGTCVAFVTGYFSLRLLLGLLRSGKFSRFSYYCLTIGILGILFVE